LAATLLSDVDNFVAGINAYITKATNPLNSASMLPAESAAIGKMPPLWKPTDVSAEASLIGGIFGKGGGNEVGSALALEAMQKRFGTRGGERAWADFRGANDPEAPTTVLKQSFPYENGNPFSTKGLALPDPGSVTYPAAGAVSGGAADRST